MKKLNLLSLVMVLVTSALAFGNSEAKTEKVAKYKVRWLLAHEPIRVFERAAKQFKKEVEQNSNGQIEVEILLSSEFIKKYPSGKKYFKHNYLDDVAMVRDGEVEMTQAYTTELGRLNSTMWVLDLPFLFKNHDHAKKIIDGEIGQKIMSGLQANNVHGLAFTYSGGYRVISSKDKPISSVDDFKNLTIRTSRSPVTKSMYQMLGAKTREMTHDAGIQSVKAGSLMAAETTIARFDENQRKATPIINDTQHSLFLTSMVVNEKYYSSLPKELQEVVHKAARNAAESERQDSLTDEKQLRAAFANQGVKVVALPAAEVKRLQEATRPVYKKFEPLFGHDLIKSIEDAQ